MLDKVPVGDKAPAEVNVIIEIPAGNRNKYEFDEEWGLIKLDRVGYSAMAHPYDYGFIPETRSDDGDHLDAMVIIDTSVFPGCVLTARPIAVMRMIDDGEGDEKIICVAANDVHNEHIKELSDLGSHLRQKIQHFFEHYKDLQHKKTEIIGWGDAAAAREEITKAQKAFQAKG